MYLRKLKKDDAHLMLEWMKDTNITNELYNDFSSKTHLDVVTFIENSNKETKDLNMAIASDDDEYMGTISLKNIDKKNKCAEFAIVVRKSAMNHGYSWLGMQEILKLAFEELELNCVYWCVSKSNSRAIRFYEKHNFHETLDISNEILKRYKEIENLKWYSVLKGDDFISQSSVSDCKVIHIKTLPTVNAGELSFFEGSKDIPFNVKRIYYVTKVPEGVRRGYHAHKNLKQLLFCPYGKIQLVLENKTKREEITLSDPSIGILITETTWREMIWLQKDSVLCVVASDYYDENDYIRNYDEFRKYIEL